MKWVRPVMYVAMAGIIGSSGYLLSTQTAASSAEAVQSIHPTAYIESDTASASFKVGGRITEILVKEGDVVKKGQVLARLQNAELEAKVLQAKAAVALTEGRIAEAKGAAATAQAKKQQAAAGVQVTADTADQQIAGAQAAVDAAQAKVDALRSGARPEERKQAEIQLQAAQEVLSIAERNLSRMTSMLEQGLVAQADVDKSKVSYQEAKTKYDLAEQQMKLVQQGPRDEEVRGAEAQLAQAKAALQLAIANKEQVKVRQGDVAAADAALQQASGAVLSAQSGEQQAKAAQQEAEAYLSYTELTAPSDGVVLSQSAQAGEIVGTGFPVFTLQDAGTHWAKFYMPEGAAAGLKPGDKVSLVLAATQEPVEGSVSMVAPAPDFAVKKATQSSGETDIRSFGVKVTLPALPPSALNGMTLRWNGKAG
ncbi:HlyD family secretion protein [Paenibacillus chartarius]|uniref:HlyD family secretion protein n=1 Tax=Paenibacillus chartarius TaxID=747481 RepID=A0ABV6DF25_9BACL